jgi:SsrA-binding protein
MSKLAVNKKAYYDYHVLEQFTAGIQLIGSEIKPVKDSKVSIKEAYCYIKDGEVFIKGMHVTPNENSNKYDNHDPYRERKLLLNKKEIRILEKGIEAKGMTLVPLRLFLNNTGLIKLHIGLCKGKKTHDKRETIKKRDQDRDIARNL